MAFPSVIGTPAVTNGVTATTTPALNIPASTVAGETLLGFFMGTLGEGVVWPSGAGWNELVSYPAFDDGSDIGDEFSIGWRLATGSDGSTVTLSNPDGGKFSGIVIRITDAADPTVTPPEFSAGVRGTSTTPNPGNCTPTGGAKDYLWIWSGGWEGEQTSPPASNPTNYTSNKTGADSGTAGQTHTNCRCAIVTRQLNAASEDPGSWTISASGNWAAITVAVHPAGAPFSGPWPQPRVYLDAVRRSYQW